MQQTETPNIKQPLVVRVISFSYKKEFQQTKVVTVVATSLTAEAFTTQDDTNLTNNSQALTNPLLTFSKKMAKLSPS